MTLAPTAYSIEEEVSNIGPVYAVRKVDAYTDKLYRILYKSIPLFAIHI